MRAFEYARPATLQDAIALLQAGPDPAILAGGTDLLVQIKEHVRQPARVIDIKRIPGMDEFAFDAKEGLRLGALVTTRAVETSPLAQRHYASLARAATDFASIQVRHRATVVGNVCRASPSADTLPPLVADGAELVIHGPGGERRCRVEDFCLGPGRTALQAGEIVTQLRVPAPPPGTGKVYIKHGRRAQMELATVGVAVTLTLREGCCERVSIVLAAVAPTPLRARAAEALLQGKAPTPERFERAAEAAAAESRPIADVRASAEYRRDMVRVLTRRALEQALRRAQEEVR
ncbi:FAD binding domain-containing protein [Ramlibacter rhizophilus]|uniref:Xanthine dehydrogenase family protein subunit M n=1 Tax=Ramlibacter rhizophilus TaxID=1781167 RepID=A0A4Z0BTE2_9BURK|nr:xanthine dehydrogenase family protein subunit M [Ramlibacter rhizophilus]TFZ01295.1 xanthine dehydrogenase family protein subunit M [Ramlibacter rhizophilus]